MSYATFLRQRRRNDIISRTPKTEDLGYYPYIAGTALNPALNAKVSPGANSKTNKQRLQEQGYYAYLTGTSPEPSAAAAPSAAQAVTPTATPTTGAVDPNAVSPTTPTPTMTTEEQYAAWLTGRGYTPTTVTAPKYEAATTPEMSYADYLKRTGMAGVSQRQYDATVRSAEADYAKGKATYGQKAETLAQRGLTGSGYGDYLTGASFAAMQNAKVAAADTKALTDAEMARGYGEYLTGVQQANAQAAAQAANANEEARVAAENANAQAAAEAEAYNREQFKAESADVQSIIDNGVAAGLSDERIQYEIQLKYGNAFDGSLSSWLNEGRTALQRDTETVNTENQNRANLAVKQYFAPDENGNLASVGDVRSAMLADGYTEEQIDAAMTQYSKDFLARQLTNINLKGITLNDIPTNDQIDNEVTLGRLTEADAATLKADAMNKRNELLVNKFENEVDTPEEETAFFAQIDEMRANGEISTKTYKGLYKQRLEANLETLLSSGEDPLVALADLDMFINSIANNVSGGLGAYLKSELANKMDVDIDIKVQLNAAVEGAFSAFKAGKELPDTGIKEAASTAVKSAIKATHELTPAPLPHVAMEITIDGKTEEIKLITAGVISKKTRDALGEGADGDVKVYSNKLYYNIKGIWTTVIIPSNFISGNTNIGGKNRAEALYDLLLHKYR